MSTSTFYPWSRLSDDLAEEIASFLPYQTLLAIHQTSKHAYHTQTKSFSSVWQQHCEKVWLTSTLDNATSWYTRFIQLNDEMGIEFIHIYARVGKCWKRLKEWLIDHAPMIAATLPTTGVPLQTLRTASSTASSLPLHLTFPIDLLCWYRIRDGQDVIPVEENTGALGSFSFYDFMCDLHMNPFERLSSTAILIARQYRRTLIPLTYSFQPPNAVTFFLDEQGRVIRLYSDRQTSYIVAETFIDWMETYVSRLYAGHYAVHPQTGICRFPSGPAYGSDTTTRGIRIQIGVLFIPEQSQVQARPQPRYLFSYKVRITFVDEHSTMRARLTTRTWHIKDARNHVEHVHGPGVIGYHPEVYAGCPPFEYESCSPLSTTKGEMSGSFQFRVDGETDELDAIIAPFILDIDQNYN